MPRPANRLRIIIALTAVVLALTARPIPLATGFSIALLWGVFFDSRAFRRVAKLKFWIFSLTIAVLAGLWLGSDAREIFGVRVSLQGLKMGLLMNVRAFTLVVSGSILFHSVGREQFMAFTSRLGLKHLDPAFAAAMETLPKVKANWQTARTTEHTSRFRAVARLMAAFADLAQGEPVQHSRLFGITGSIGIGKSTTLNQIAANLESSGIKVGGFLQKSHTEPPSDETIYELVRWCDKQRMELGRKSQRERFAFNEDAFTIAREWLLADAASAQVILIDELGKREAAGEGYSTAVSELLAGYPYVAIIAVIRKDKLPELSEQFGFPADQIMDMDDNQQKLELFTQAIIAAVEKPLA
ncbi:MAG: nucleoside-triphosphatase [Calditrichota bacterium]